MNLGSVLLPLGIETAWYWDRPVREEFESERVRFRSFHSVFGRSVLRWHGYWHVLASMLDRLGDA